MIIECNKKPLFAEEPTNAEVRRIIDIYFPSIFTTNPAIVDPENRVFLANQNYKESIFQEKYKYALMKILMEEYKVYIKNEKRLDIPRSIIDRTQTYLELSCNLVGWFKDNYEFTGDKTDILKIREIYDNLTDSIYFYNLTKYEKQKYNRSYFTNYVETNIFFKKYYKVREAYNRNFISQWTKKEEKKYEE